MPSEVSTVEGDQSMDELRRELAEAREQQAAAAEKDFNVADPVFAEGLRDGRSSISRTNECDRSVDPKRGVSSGCAKHQVAA
jgi:hypothetical protein